MLCQGNKLTSFLPQRCWYSLARYDSMRSQCANFSSVKKLATMTTSCRQTKAASLEIAKTPDLLASVPTALRSTHDGASQRPAARLHRCSISFVQPHQEERAVVIEWLSAMHVAWSKAPMSQARARICNGCLARMSAARALLPGCWSNFQDANTAAVHGCSHFTQATPNMKSVSSIAIQPIHKAWQQC